jgi:hypothetical protein
MPLCNKKLAEMEVNLEKLATGDNYNSYAVGKGKERVQIHTELKIIHII